VERYEKKEPFGGIPGVAISKDNRIGDIDNKPITDLDEIPFPD